MLATNEPVCQTCHKTHPWPDGTTPRHPFVGMGDTEALPKKEDPARRVVVDRSPYPFDPVLRLALINKGIITPDELKAAQDQISLLTPPSSRPQTRGDLT